MRKNFKELFGIPITSAKKATILEEIEKWLGKTRKSEEKKKKKQPKTLSIFTPNPEIIAFSFHDKKFKEIVAKAHINIPDGNGIVWALRFLQKGRIEKISGVDFVAELCQLSSQKGFRIGLIGGKGKVALSAGECLERSYNNLRVTVLDAPEIKVAQSPQQILIHSNGNPPLGAEKYFRNLARVVRQKNIDILFVALGHPKQEYFIHLLSSHFSHFSSRPLVLMAVGGALDYLSGSVPRAPKWVRERGFEWLFRLLLNPQRLPRQLRGGEFFYRVLMARIHS
ncbi:WecB/TagA/CpsF family glycosyltransferase [Candidatus Gottesmanbacteria bacterium]|nr:WecB/TagA/CpsF family glycosyltransferase [Candidatus Gottesmanbacteria bacterium]